MTKAADGSSVLRVALEGPGVAALRALVRDVDLDVVDADPTSIDVAAIVRAAQIVCGVERQPATVQTEPKE